MDLGIRGTLCRIVSLLERKSDVDAEMSKRPDEGILVISEFEVKIDGLPECVC